MELLTTTVLLAVFLCSSAPSPSVVAPADCSDAEIEKDAGRALNLINKHRREGYVFTLLRVADAHVQHAGNVSILYFTLDVVDTECPVLSRKEWTSCRHRVFYPNTEFGQCKAVLYKNSLFKKAELFGYNCTISPVPPELYECKDCVVKVTNLLDVDSYTDEAKKILEKHSRESNETQGFRVEKVKKAFSMVGSRKGHHVEFTIIEADGPKAGFPKNNASERSFPPERHRHTGFCIGRVVQELEIVEVVSCVIYDIPDQENSIIVAMCPGRTMDLHLLVHHTRIALSTTTTTITIAIPMMVQENSITVAMCLGRTVKLHLLVHHTRMSSSSTATVIIALALTIAIPMMVQENSIIVVTCLGR
ncbi:hypothetical protein JRQ81_017742 [Phrynocephalus forsythii]|uniref:Histidine-rich glycoprotein n=1 Tax=Phrynocephalus forsythii TaxID=171643 RepID=A0A9Q0XRY3_9SAUR|nr:hypothetical protein JRQ81_017742 [Phrynocephalus forsythii]